MHITLTHLFKKQYFNLGNGELFTKYLHSNSFQFRIYKPIRWRPSILIFDLQILNQFYCGFQDEREIMTWWHRKYKSRAEWDNT